MKRDKWFLPSLTGGVATFVLCMMLLHEMFSKVNPAVADNSHFNVIVAFVSVFMGLFSFGMVAFSWKD